MQAFTLCISELSRVKNVKFRIGEFAIRHSLHLATQPGATDRNPFAGANSRGWPLPPQPPTPPYRRKGRKSRQTRQATQTCEKRCAARRLRTSGANAIAAAIHAAPPRARTPPRRREIATVPAAAFAARSSSLELRQRRRRGERRAPARQPPGVIVQWRWPETRVRTASGRASDGAPRNHPALATKNAVKARRGDPSRVGQFLSVSSRKNRPSGFW